MTFPTQYRGRVSWRSKTGIQSEQVQQDIVAHLEKALAKAKGSPRVEGNRVYFTGGFFRFVSNWNVLVPITEGYIEVLPEGDGYVLAYELRFKELIVIASTIAGGLFVMSSVAERSVPIVAKFILCSFVWGSLFGLNFLMGIVRFPMFLTSVLKRL